MTNTFLKNVNKNNTTTANGAVSHSTSGSALTDQFAISGNHRDRDISLVFSEQSLLYNENPIYSLRFVFYLRLITRVVDLGDHKTDTLQKGQGNRDESFKRFLWYAQNHPETFYKNLSHFTKIGSEKDLFELMWYAQKYSISLDYTRCIQEVLLSNLSEDNSLLMKYLPLQKATSKLKTDRAIFRNFISNLISKQSGISQKELRLMKSKGQAHTWQQFISKRMFDNIEFNKISGKALFNLIHSKFLKNSGLEEKYSNWIMSKPVAKFTGYVYELGDKVKNNNALYVKNTIDKQFQGLIEMNKTLSTRKVITAIDRSSSMLQPAGNTLAMNLAESLGIYFSTLLEGEFKDWVIRFSSRSEWVKLAGTFSEKKLQMKWGDCPSNTDFQSIIDSFVRVRKDKPSVPESDFPNTLLVLSDMQFDRSGTQTNYQTAISKLSEVFSPEWVKDFVFIWWDCRTQSKIDYPQNIDEPGGYLMSGFDGAILNTLLGKIDNKKEDGSKPSMEESIFEILSQESLMVFL